MALSSVIYCSKNIRPLCNDQLPEDTDCEFCVLSVGKSFNYVIPSFDILAVKLRPMRVTSYNDDNVETMYDYFVRDDSDLSRAYPSWMKVKDLTVVDPKEFSKVVKTDLLKFPTCGVCIIWDWGMGRTESQV